MDGVEAPSNTEAEYTAGSGKPISSEGIRQQPPANGGRLQQPEGAPTATPILPPHASDGPLSEWLSELVTCSGIALDVALLNAAPFGPGTDRHWEDEREELIRHKRHKLETEKLSGNGHVQNQAGHLSASLLSLRKTYRHLAGGGWRTLSDQLPGLPAFNQWKPAESRQAKDGRTVKYETPAGFPDGGGLLLPRVPDRVWRLICQQQDLPFPSEAVRAAGFWVWALATPGLKLTIVEGFKKALAAISCGVAAVALPGVTMGRRTDGGESQRLIAELQLLAAGGRDWVICFDADRKPKTAAMVYSAAKSLANCLLKAACTVSIARLELLDDDKLGLDDLLITLGEDAVLAALAKAKPYRRESVSIGRRHFKASDIPHPEIAPLVALRGGMGSNKERPARHPHGVRYSSPCVGRSARRTPAAAGAA
jgi:hypothetical protein